MCGITGIHFKNDERMFSRKKLDQLVNELLLGIESRGKDATGLVVVERDGKVTLDKRAVTAKTFTTQRKRLPNGVRTILGHTRFATQGEPSKNENNHPVKYRTCYAVHNGHIYNDSKLFQEFSLERNAEVDSEIIPALFANFGLDKAHLALQELEGNMAVAVVDPERFPGQLILAKGWSSPLHIFQNDDAIVWSSEVSAIQDAVEKVLGVKLRLADFEQLYTGDLLYVDHGKVESLNFKCNFSNSSKKLKASTTTYTHTATDGDLGWAEPYTDSERRRWHKECTSCGHYGMWHGYNRPFAEGPCYLADNKNVICKCVGYVEPAYSLPAATPYEWCDGCHDEFPMTELVQMGGKKWLLCKDKCLQEVAKANVSKIVTVPDWAQREEIIHQETLKLMARSTGDTEAFIGWLLFECSTEIMESSKSGFLMKKHTELDALYIEAEEVIRDQIDAIIEKATEKEAQTGGLVKAQNVVDQELEEAEAHLLDIALEGECSVRVFDEVEELVA